MTTRECLPVAEAFVVATVAPALLWLPWGAGLSFFVLLIAAAHALCLGAPVVCVLRDRGQLTMGMAVAGGFAIGAGPCALLMLPTTLNGTSTGFSVLDYLTVVLVYGGSGAFSGIVFGCYLWAREACAASRR
jgi:hypothetical protein